MNMNLFLRFIILTALIIASACAKISSPTGGLRDRKPPVVVKSIPENEAKNFREKRVSVTFDEYVVLDNINDKFMVSPPMKKKPRVFIKGKSVNVEFEDVLKDSTTYTFYFQDAIKDLNEGNILANYQFVFSTGEVIDSLSVTGNVFNSFNLEIPEKTLVLMYSDLADSAVIKDLPDYISRVNSDGYFRIDNVRPGNFRLYALKDDDNSKNYNYIEEEFAFLDSIVAVTPEKNFIPLVKDTTTVKKGAVPVPKPAVVTGEHQLILFAAQKRAHYLTNSSRDIKYQLIYTLSLPPDTMDFEFSIPGTGRDAYLEERSRNKDTLRIWLADSSLYSRPQITTIVKYPFNDTLGVLGYKEDTLLMRYLAPRAPRSAKVKKPVLIVNSNISSGFLGPGQAIAFYSETPLREPDTSKIKLYELIERKKQDISYQFIKDSTNAGKYTLNAKILQGKQYLFVADSASFRNIFNECTDSTGVKFTVRDPESYGKLTLNLTNLEGNWIIQLLNNQERLVREEHIEKDGKMIFQIGRAHV
jgi:hypothetical protein